MYRYNSFTPGNNSNARKLIHYVYMYDVLGKTPSDTCTCVLAEYDKNTPNTFLSTNRVPYGVRISQIINYSRGGKTQFGSFYLGEPLNVNYLGRVEGMAGGSGSPPVNRFN